MPSTGTVVAAPVDLLDAPRDGARIETLQIGAKVETQIIDTAWPLVLSNPDGAANIGYVDATKVRWDVEPLDPPAQQVGAGDLVFTGKARAPCSRFNMIKGELAVPVGSGPKAIFNINSGGYGPSYRNFAGPTPPGTYKVTGPFPADPKGMTVGLVGFKFPLLPNTLQVPGGDVRGSFCIHPDGPPPGTLGCLGLNEREDRLTLCKNLIAGLIAHNGSLKVIVQYDPGVLF